MAKYYLDSDGKIKKYESTPTKSTTTKKKKKSSYYMDSDGKIKPYTDEEIAYAQGIQNGEERTWFSSGAFSDGYQGGDVTRTILGTTFDLAANVGGGLLEIGEGVVDAGAYLVGGIGKLFGADEFAEDTKKFIADDLYSGEEVASRILTLGQAGEGFFDDESILGEKADSLAQSGGQLVGNLAITAATGGAVPWWLTTGVTSFGQAAEEAFGEEDTSYKEAGLRGIVSAGAEILTEKLFGGSGLGEKGLINLDALTKGISSKAVKALADLGVDMAAEGAEEVASSVINRFASKLYKEESLGELLFSEEAFDEYLESFIGGAVLGGVMNTSNAVRSVKNKTDYRTGITANEQKVFDAEYEKRIAEKEKDGKKLSKNEKAKIYDDVLEDMKEGGISTDTIAEVLGGDSYKAYQEAIEKDNQAIAELESIYEGEELNQAKEEILKNSERDSLKAKLNEEVFNSVKGSKDQYLVESYNEVARKGQDFEADLTKYDEKQQKVIKNAIDAGFLNNTNKTHKLVDWISRIAADKDIDFDFANNEKIKNSGFAIEGKTVNGYVDKATGKVTLNLESAKALQSTVGHEITHVLEGTELYDSLQNALFEYAQVKGEYKTRLAEALKLYKDVEGYELGAKGLEDIKKEVAADLVGDYLFQDTDFIRKLHAENRNVFQKVWDEIKYLCKIATAGSQEARQLAKVQKAFEDVYRESVDVKTEAKGEVKNSLSVKEVNGKEHIVSPLSVTRSEILNFMDMSQKRRLEDHTYFPVSKSTPNTLISTLRNAGINITDKPLAMQAKKARQSQIDAKPYKKDGVTIRFHAMKAEEILEAIDKLDDATTIIHQTERTKTIEENNEKVVVDAPDNFAMFVTLDNGKDVVAVIEFDSTIEKKYIVEDGEGEEYHTTVTVFEPDVERDGLPFDYAEYLLSKDKNRELDIIKESPESETAYGEILATASKTELSNKMLPQNDSSVKGQYSLSSMANTFFGDANMSANEFVKVDYKQTEGYKTYVDQCINNMKQTRGDFDEVAARTEIEKSIDGIVRVAIAAKKAGYDIYDDAERRGKKDSKKRLLFSSLEPNSDYFTSNDISTICDKRKNFADIYDDIVRAEESKGVPKGKRFFDNVDNYFYLHSILAEKGLTQPCRQCYVESMRKNLAPMANAFLRLVNEADVNNKANDQLYEQKGKKKGNLKSNNAALRENVLKTFDEHPEYGMTASDLTVETLTTEDGLAQLKIQAPLIYEAFNSFYGQSKPKMPKSATPFRFGELTALLTDHKGKIKQSLVDKINSTGGFRLQSYSDFQIQNFTDVLQVIFEAGTLGLNGHAYTKVPAFLEATENTNLKRNISIFMYKDGNEWKLDRNDSFPATLEEMYEMVKADKSGNTSIIAVSQNAEMSAWIMANDLVGYGIPFHKSGMKMGTVRDTDVKTEDGRVIKGYSETKDHTKEQTEVWAKTNADHKANTKVKKGIDIYSFWDFDNKQNLSKNELIEKNVKRYIDECEKAGYLPKFRNYVMNNSTVLKDVLKFSKELGYSSPDATISDIAFEYKGYVIPYGYYKFLGDFGMFTADGKASPHDTLSLENYDFDKAEQFFANSEELRRNEILQQFANDGEREIYRNSNFSAEELAEVVKRKRSEVVESVVSPTKRSLSEENAPFKQYGNFATPANELMVDKNLAPTKEDLAEVEADDDFAPVFQQAESVRKSPIAEQDEPISAPITAEEETVAANDPQKARLEKSIKRIDSMLEYDKKDLEEEIQLRREELEADDESGHYALDEEYKSRLKELEEAAETKRKNARTAHKRKAKTEEYSSIAEDLAGDTSTWVDKKLGLSYKINTLRRNLRDIVRDANGKRDIAKADAIYDELQGKYNVNEAELNREANRIKKAYADMKITDAESTYIQMLGEYRHNPETTLTADQVKEFLEEHKGSIDEAKVDKAIELARETYDSLLQRVNEVLKEQGMKEIPYRKGYFPHFNEEKQGFFAKLFNWKTQNNDIPTDIAGLTEQFNPNRSWQSFNKQRKSDATDYNFLKGMDTYVHGALDWIYHIEDIQKRRAFENHLRYIHSEEGVKKKIEAIYANEELDADEVQEQIDLVYATAKNPLNNFVTDLRAGTNRLANKKSSLDRGMEEMVNRKVYSTMTNLTNRVSANMVAGSISSALTNFIPITQSWGEVSPVSSLRAMVETIGATFRDDGVIDKSAFLTNRLKPSENLYNTTWDKIGKGVGALMEGIDNFTSQTVWRSKYNENISNGMSESEAIKNADQFAENVMAGRSRGNNPTIFDSKNPLMKILTAFQLEVNNQYGYMFKDMPQDVKNGSKARLVKGYATMFLGAYAYNALYSSLTGRDSAFDPIGIVEDLLRDMGLLGDDEEEEPVDVALNLAENIMQEVPFIGGLMGGGRVPISSALPYDGNLMDMIEGTGNAIAGENVEAATKEWLKPLWYLAMPMGGGQTKKTIEGLSMFDDDHPVSGSYTNSGALRFPVEDTFGNRIKAALFGQYSSGNAREYFEGGYAPLEEKQIQEYIDLDAPIGDYWNYREGLKGLKTIEEKADYINSLDLEDWQKNLLINNIADRKEDIDMTNYDDYGSFEEFDYAQKYPEKYAIATAVGGYDSYTKYSSDLNDIKADKDKNGNAISGSRKKKVMAYIESLNISKGQKLILHKSQYPSDTSYNREIVEYLNSREDISFEQWKTILKELGFTVSEDGKVRW